MIPSAILYELQACEEAREFVKDRVDKDPKRVWEEMEDPGFMMWLIARLQSTFDELTTLCYDLRKIIERFPDWLDKDEAFGRLLVKCGHVAGERRAVQIQLAMECAFLMDRWTQGDFVEACNIIRKHFPYEKLVTMCPYEIEVIP